MAPPFKLTPPQRQFLLMYMGDFIKRQAEKKLSLFWPLFFKAWFAAYPEHASLELPVPGSPEQRPLTAAETKALGDAIQTKKAQLTNCFRNGRQKLVSATNGAADSAIAAVLSRILKLGPAKRQRTHQPIEIFQKRNPELIKAALVEAGYDLLNSKNDADEDDDWTDESEDSPAARAKRAKSQRMRLRTQTVRILWNEAEPDEREAVQEELEEEKLKAAVEAQQKSEGLSPGTPAQRQEGIDGLETLFTAVHRAIFELMGWVGFTICGGPNPRMNGDLTLKIFCFGETDEGNDFEACYVDFNKNIVQAFQDFLRLCFSEESCASWATQTTAPSVLDGRTVERINSEVPQEAPAPTTTTKKQSKTKSKTTKSKSKTKPKKTTSSTEIGPSEVHSASDDAPSAPDDAPTTPLRTEDLVLPSENADLASESPGPEGTWFLSDEPEDVPSTTHQWPAGMTAPLSPEAATALGTIERGGLPNLATMAIDPQLLDHSDDPLSRLPESTSHVSYPKPKPARTSTSTTAPTAVTTEPIVVGPTINVDGYNFPLTSAGHSPAASTSAIPSGSADPFRRSELFSVFASRQPLPSVFPSTPYIPSKAFQSAFNTRSPIAPPTSQSRQTWAARTTLATIADHNQGKSDTSHANNSSSSPPPATSTPSSPPAPAAPASHPIAPPSTPSSPPAPAAPASHPIAPPSTLPSPPAPAAPVSRPVAAEPPLAPILPLSRPAVQPPTPKTTRKTSTASAAKKESAAIHAAKVAVVEDSVKKPRGRPRRSPLANDITNDLIGDPASTPLSPPSTSMTPAALPATSPPSMNIPSTSTTSAPAAPPSADIPEIPRGNVNICVDPGRFGNRFHAKLAAEKEKKEKAAAAAAKKKGWVQREVAGATVVTFNGPATSTSATDPPARTSARGRPLKTAKRPDGTDVQAVTKGTRKAVAAEASVPAAGNKRKAASAPTTTKPSGKR
ncbi:hypothetical protein R3P38DRAFT_3337293 [Favolaschia claudopus]|uniref:Uncharacterized protein n=1 Tax=Favolaschia claudopus TaxID=2862362 RepID=A0AAV9Z2F0_9AGAR